MYFNPTSRAVWLNQDGLCGSVNVYRNTLVGSVYVSTLNDANDGPFTFKNNVIVNSDTGYPSQIMTYGAYTNLVVIGTGSEANLAATSGIVDSAGNLTGTYQQYLGTHGYQIPE